MIRILDRTVEVAAVIIFAASSLAIIINVVNRYLVLGLMRDLSRSHEILEPIYQFFRDLFGTVSVTADEIPGLLLVWVAFLGAYLAMRREGHIAFDLLLDRTSGVWKAALITINTTLILGFLAVLLWQSIRMIRVSGATEIETAGIAQGWFMAILPITAILLAVAVIMRVAGHLKNR